MRLHMLILSATHNDDWVPNWVESQCTMSSQKHFYNTCYHFDSSLDQAALEMCDRVDHEDADMDLPCHLLDLYDISGGFQGRRSVSIKYFRDSRITGNDLGFEGMQNQF